MGELRLLGTKVPRSDSPEKRGGPWAPPPRGVLLKAVLLCVWSLVEGFGFVFGKFKKVWCFGTSFLLLEPFKLRPCKASCLLCFGVPGWGCIVPRTVAFMTTRLRRTDRRQDV